MVVFREIAEDLYGGIKFKAGMAEAEKARTFLNDQVDASLPDEVG